MSVKLVNKEKNSMFVSDFAKVEYKFEECGFFIHKNQHTKTNVLGYLIPVYYRFFGTVIDFGESGKDSLSFLHLFINNFYTQMPKSVKIEANMNNSNVCSTPCSTTPADQIKDITDRLISWDDPKCYADTVEMLWGIFLSSDLADEPKNRSNAWFHILELRKFLTRLESFNPRKQKTI